MRGDLWRYGEMWAAGSTRRRIPPSYLPYISPTSRLYLAYISRLSLAYISVRERQAHQEAVLEGRKRADARLAEAQAVGEGLRADLAARDADLVARDAAMEHARRTWEATLHSMQSLQV